MEHSEILASELLKSLDGWDMIAEHHTAKTPERFVKMLRDMTTREDFNFTTFPNEGIDQMITLHPIPYYALCAHHIVPFFGNAYIGYIPDKSMAGLSKFPRAVRYVAKGFWVQEELTNSIADYLEKHLKPLGLAVVLDGEHMCMSMRGVMQPNVVTTTSSMRGVFLNPRTGARNEFLSFVQGNRK